MTPRLSPQGHAALALAAEIGLPVFPCIPRSKEPAVGPLKADGSRWDRKVDPKEARAVLGGFHRATTDPETVAMWWLTMPDANVAVRLGGYARVCCVEADTADGQALLLDLAAGWPRTWAYQASRGTNWLFRAPDDIAERPQRHLWPETYGHGIECKTGNGAVTLPPSVHPTGHVYAWVAGCTPWDIPLAPLPAVLADEVRRSDAEREALEAGRREPQTPLVRTFAPPVEPDTFDAARTLDALRYIDATDYATWRDVGMALKSTGHPDARTVWDMWSVDSDKFDPREQDRQWEYFSPSAITVASIFYYAGKAGWQARRAA